MEGDTMNNMFIIHGYQANINSHWFDWLAKEMAYYHYQVEIIYLPNTHHPQTSNWYAALDDRLKDKLNENTLIVAHSLGVITILNYLSHQQFTPKIKGLFLISGFNETLDNLPELDTYIKQTNVRCDKVNSQNVVTIAASEDPIVDVEATKRLSNELGVSTQIITHNGHFLDTEGYHTFEFLKDQIIAILNKINTEIGM